MASIANDPGGRRRILFVDDDGTRRAIRLGKMDRKNAETICRHVEELLAAKITGQPVARPTAVWLANISPKLRQKLAAARLTEAPQQAALGEFLRAYILTRPDVKPTTLAVWKQTCQNLLDYFGQDKPLREVTTGECDQFKAWLLTQELAATTVAKRLAFARTFFHVARRHRLIEANPFVEVKIPTASVNQRQRFITREMTQRLLDVASPTWRTIIALARYGGLRCPSEVLTLEFRHVDWERNRITVISPKTERYAGKESREIPLFAELRPYLQEAFELAQPGQTHVVGGNHLPKSQGPNGWRNCNLRTTFAKLVRRAGLEPWPRLFHNLRSSRETELLEQFPIQVVADWMGHTPQVSLKHYAQTTQEHFDRAVGQAAGFDPSRGGANSGALAAQIPAQQAAARNGNESPAWGLNLDANVICAVPCETQVFAAQGLAEVHGNRTHRPHGSRAAQRF